MLTAISTTEVTPFVRVPWLEPGIIMKVFDSGSYGVICPMIKTREDAERLVSYCRYAPKGIRSLVHPVPLFMRERSMHNMQMKRF